MVTECNKLLTFMKGGRGRSGLSPYRGMPSGLQPAVSGLRRPTRI